MQKTLLLLTMTFLSYAYNQGGTHGPFEDRDRWLLVERMDRTPLRARPKQVTEYTIYPASDTVHPEHRREFYIRYRFDSSGIITSKDSYMGGKPLVLEARSTRPDGYWVKMLLGDSNHIAYVITRLLADGRFKVIYQKSKWQFDATIYSFTPDGSEEIQEVYPDSNAHGTPPLVIHNYFNGNRLLRFSNQRGHYKEEGQFYYSGAGGPDSVLLYRVGATGNTLYQRQLFLRNSQGDAVRKLVISDGDTVSLDECRYVYDAKGNWIRRLTIPVINNARNQWNEEPSVDEREFVY